MMNRTLLTLNRHVLSHGTIRSSFIKTYRQNLKLNTSFFNRNTVRSISSLHGIDVTCASPDAVSLYDDAISDYLGLTGDPVGKLEAAIRHDPGFLMAHCMMAMLILLSGNVNGLTNPVILKLRRRCQIMVEKNHCTHRERVHVAAMTAFAEGRCREAAALWEAWLLEQPVDALTIRHLHDTYYFLGDHVQLRDSVGRVLGAWEVAHPEYQKVCGMFAFGAEECNNYKLAEDQGMRALAQDARDPWALHAVIHVYEMQGRRYEGQRLLRDSRWFWSEAALLHVHLQWHWALFQIDEGQFERSFIRYDWWLRENHSAEAMDLIDAASLLWRLELAGNQVYDRWEELAALVEQHIHTHSMVFFDAHIAMILAAAGRDELLQEHLTSLRRFAFEAPYFSESGSSSVKTEFDPVDDVDWMWSGVKNEWDSSSFRTKSSERLMHSNETVQKQSQITLPSSTQTAPGAFANNHSVLGTIGYFSNAQADDRTLSTHIPVQEDFPLMQLDESNLTSNSVAFSASVEENTGFEDSIDLFGQNELSSRGAGGRERRPLLTCPMSTLPVLPLRIPSPTDNQTSAPPLLQDELVSVGGVGGYGLGSHSIYDQRYLAATIGVPLIEGIIAYRQGMFDLAVDKLMPLRSIWKLIGGSRAQLDVFHLTLEAAATQSGQLLLARALLRERLTQRPNSGLATYHLSSVLYGTGEYRKAGQARDRALRLGLGEERVSTPQLNRMAHTEDSWHR